MPYMANLLYPLNLIQPNEIIRQYQGWIYFALMLVFFIALAGIALRKHFDRPYVKPLIITVGLMMTVGLFKFRSMLPRIFEGFGIIGSILLLFVAAFIPFGLSRGFGMRGNKAFFLTYILFYVIGWAQFSDVFYAIGDKGLGLVNLALFVVFVVSIIKITLPGKGLSMNLNRSGKSAKNLPEINRELQYESEEDHLIDSRGEKLTRIEIRTLADIQHALKKIIRIIESQRNNLAREECEDIAGIIQSIHKKEELFRTSAKDLRSIYSKLQGVDLQQLKEKTERLHRAKGKEHAALKSEISVEEEKIELEKEIMAFEKAMEQRLFVFNQRLGDAAKLMRSPYPYDSKPCLDQAEDTLINILEGLKNVKRLEEKLEKMIKTEEKLLKAEKKTT